MVKRIDISKGVAKIKSGEVARTEAQEEQLVGLLETIDELPMYVGAPEFGDNTKLIILMANYIMRQFPSIDSTKLVEAFELAASGKLYSNHKRINVSTYGRQLSIDTVGTVLGAYKQFKEDEKRQPPPYIPSNRQLAEPKPEPVSDEWHYNHLLNYVKEHNAMPLAHLWESIFRHLNPDAVDMPKKSARWYEQKVTEHFIKEKLLNNNY